MKRSYKKKSKSGRILLVQKHTVRQTYNTFEWYCNRGLESVVYWYGLELHGLCVDVVMALAIPDAECHATCYDVPAEEAARMGNAMMEDSLVCLAQFHTHPGKHTRHSVYDDQNSLSTRNGFLSLVAPKYGYGRDLSLDKVSIHEAWDGRWHLLARPAGNQRIRIVEDTVDLRVDK